MRHVIAIGEAKRLVLRAVLADSLIREFSIRPHKTAKEIAAEYSIQTHQVYTLCRSLGYSITEAKTETP